MITPYFLQTVGGHNSPLGRLRADKRIFRLADSNEPWRYKGRTAFKLMELFAQGQDIAGWVRIWTSIGYNTFRVFRNKPAATWNGGSDPGWSTPPLNVAEYFIKFMAGEGARVEVTLVTQVESDLNDIGSWSEMISQYDNTFLEGVNEPDNRKSDYQSVYNRIAANNTPVASGNYDTTRQMLGNYMTWHADRNGDPGEFARKAKGILEMYDGWDGYVSPRVPVVGDEPGKPMEYGYDLPATMAHFAIYGLFGAGGTFHDLDSQFCNPPSDSDYACAVAAVRALDAFPLDAPNNFAYRHDDQAKADETTTGSVRTYLTTGPYGVRCCPKDGSPTLIGV